MALAMAQIGKSYGLPVYLNINLTDAKLLDVQAGMEKMGSLLMGALSGADLIGHAGIVGTDHGASLPWLVIDNEAVNYAKRVLRGFDVNLETLADDAISEPGPGGNFLAHRHTVKNFRKELWLPSRLWERDTFDGWQSEGGKSMYERAVDQVNQILNRPIEDKLESKIAGEIDRIVKTAWNELVDK